MIDFTLCKTAKITFIDENSAQIFKEKEHVLIGISPCNSYYSKEKIEQILVWVLEQNFKNFHFYTGDEMWFYNYQAFGYSAKEARIKMQEKNKQLLAKLKPLLYKYQISEDKIIYYQDLNKNENYKKYKMKYEKLVIEDQVLFQIISILIQQLKNTGQHQTILYPNFAYQAIALELPLILQFSELFNYTSSVFIYHQNNSFYQYLYRNEKLKYHHQGFLNLYFE